MNRRLLLVLAAILFFGWLGVLAYTVAGAGKVPVVSRAQFINATHVVVAEVTLAEDGKPKAEVELKEILSGAGLDVGKVLVVSNMPSTLAAGGRAVVAGPHLLLLKNTNGTYKVAGLPRSPGVDAAPESSYRPVVYPWNEAVQAQMRSFGVLK